MADLDADGHPELISGSWPGEIFLFRGGPDGPKGPPEELKGQDGKVINVGGGIQRQPGGMTLITGNAKFENEGGKKIVIYQGERLEFGEGESVGITGCASAVCATDWDADGDIDLLVGDIRGNVWLLPNEGTPKQPAFGEKREVQAGGKILHVEGDAGPFAADWDGDGKLDLLVGAGDGGVTFFRNTGNSKEPTLGAGRILIPPAPDIWSNPPTEPRPGVRTKLCAADWDGDGRLDLLVGDLTMQKVILPEFTEAEKAEHARLLAQLEDVARRSNDVRSKYDAAKGEERTKLEQQIKELSEQLRAIQVKLPREEEYHGWVWLYLRRPAEENASR